MTLLPSVLFGLIAMVAYGITNAHSKPLAQKYGPSRLLFLRGIVICLALVTPAFLFHKNLDHAGAVFGTILLGVIGYFPVLAFTYAVQKSRVSIVAPIVGSAPLVTVLLAYTFLGTPIDALQWFAILLVVTANLAIATDLKNWRNSSALQLSSGIPFAFGAAIGWGLFYFFLVPSTALLGPWMSAFLAEIGVTIAAAWHVRGSTGSLELAGAKSRDIIINGILVCVGTLAFTIGVSYFNVAVVATLANSTAVVATLLAAVLFKEELHLKEKIAVGVMIAGIAIISVSRTAH